VRNVPASGDGANARGGSSAAARQCSGTRIKGG
jgi:hypothetical protein